MNSNFWFGFSMMMLIVFLITYWFYEELSLWYLAFAMFGYIIQILTQQYEESEEYD